MGSENPHKHYWDFCELCSEDRGDLVVICGKCGNNCCNAGYGTLPNGDQCDACPSAYEMQKHGQR